jgi:hypothetical protein
MQQFIAVSLIVNAFLGIIWSRDRWINTLIKCMFFGLAVWAGWLLATDLGYVVKVGA